MPHIRIKQAAELLGVSDDTLRRWVEQGLVESRVKPGGRREVSGASLAAYSKKLAEGYSDPLGGRGANRSARNQFTGLVTDIVRDRVMSQVEIQAGPHRIVSLVSTQSVDELGLRVGSVAAAVVKATNVHLETER